MAPSKTKQEAINYALSLEGKGLDFDNFAGWQCFDVANYYWNYIFGHGLKGEGAKDIPNPRWNDLTQEAYIYPNTPEFLAEAGDLAIFSSRFGGGYGHVGIVIEATLDYIVLLEQNWLGGGITKTEVTTRRKHNYEYDMIFVRPKYKKEGSGRLPKKKILLVAGHGLGYWSNDSGAAANGYNERDFIRKNIVPNVAKHLRKAGHDVHLYGGETMNQDLFQDTRYGEMVGNYSDYGMYWVARQGFDSVTEFHLDAAGAQASGGHVIIGMGLSPDTIDKAIQNTIYHFIGTIRNIDPRDNLLNVNVAKNKGVNYRLAELGFITSAKDMNNIINNLESYTRGIAEDIHGGKLEPVKLPAKEKAKEKVKQVAAKVTKKKPTPANNTSKPKTEWAWKGQFTTFASNTQPIVVRRAVGLNAAKVDVNSWIYPNQWVPFDRLIKKDGYWWIRFEYPTNPSAGKFYMPIGKIGKTGKVKVDKTLWGTLDIKSYG
ncbi:N-acetylmuramoyl-L-alanine amidase [Staphylococcus pseudintermedius]|nr:N-acetylmuramoyl-L-alanine amidase [Staphylococcus pseudintermedius]MDF0081302.1 N-acetylmuramoyl-L-alanine amidase [Staphylococcus pseudintermedius]HDV6035376.1 N-acetylmuramoyl-L-alanine amidase [Staphylococcus pseudintermedius]